MILKRDAVNSNFMVVVFEHLKNYFMVSVIGCPMEPLGI
jgi:hypothetical protein